MATINFFCASGGGSRGAFQVGVLDGLCKKNILLDGFAGVSTGAIQAGFMAQANKGDLADQQAVVASLIKLWRRIKGDNDIYHKPDFGVIGLVYNLFNNPSLYSLSPLKKLLETNITRPPQRPVTLGVVHFTSSLFELQTHPMIPPPPDQSETRKEIVTVDDLRTSILASCSIPGFFTPVGDMADGGVRHIAPLRHAFDLARTLVNPGDTLNMHVALASPVELDTLNKNWQHEKLLTIASRAIDILEGQNYHDDVTMARDTNEIVKWFDDHSIAIADRPKPLQDRIQGNIITYVPKATPPDALHFDPTVIEVLYKEGLASA